jgi:hypothetical protein
VAARKRAGVAWFIGPVYARFYNKDRVQLSCPRQQLSYPYNLIIHYKSFNPLKM